MAGAVDDGATDTGDRTYDAAIRIINSRQRSRRPLNAISEPEISRKPATVSGTPDLRGTPSMVGMLEWLSAIGHSVDDVARLNVIHVAGTKGKGSTCAFTESFLRSHARRSGCPRKTGLYTSPHLILPQERIRINSQPLPPDSFAKYFFEVYDRLPQLAQQYDPSLDTIARGPRYLQLFALLAFHVFIRENVDVAIVETHCGGEYDATNIIDKPVVTAVTTLGMDHVDMLGPTIENIAWHKAGIFKPGAIALSASQEPGPAKILHQRSAEKRTDLKIVGVDTRLPMDASILKPGVQKQNASLAMAAAEAFLERCASIHPDLSHEDINEGIKQFSWPGRFQILQEREQIWYLDSAHNDMSAKVAAEWFAQCLQDTSGISRQAPRILIFSHINELRDGAALLQSFGKALLSHKLEIDHVIFSTYDESVAQRHPILEHDPVLFRTTWQAISSSTRLWNEPTIQGAIALARKLGANGMHTFITGSQHLVGPTLRVLEWTGGSSR